MIILFIAMLLAVFLACCVVEDSQNYGKNTPPFSKNKRRNSTPLSIRRPKWLQWY